MIPGKQLSLTIIFLLSCGGQIILITAAGSGRRRQEKALSNEIRTWRSISDPNFVSTVIKENVVDNRHTQSIEGQLVSNNGLTFGQVVGEFKRNAETSSAPSVPVPSVLIPDKDDNVAAGNLTVDTEIRELNDSNPHPLTFVETLAEENATTPPPPKEEVLVLPLAALSSSNETVLEPLSSAKSSEVTVAPAESNSTGMPINAKVIGGQHDSNLVPTEPLTLVQDKAALGDNVIASSDWKTLKTETTNASEGGSEVMHVLSTPVPIISEVTTEKPIFTASNTAASEHPTNASVSEQSALTASVSDTNTSISEPLSMSTTSNSEHASTSTTPISVSEPIPTITSISEQVSASPTPVSENPILSSISESGQTSTTPALNSPTSELTSPTPVSEPPPTSITPVAESDLTPTTPGSIPLPTSTTFGSESLSTSTIPITVVLDVPSTTSVPEPLPLTTTPVSEPLPLSTTPVPDSDLTLSTPISEPLTTSIAPVTESDLTLTTSVSDPLPTLTTTVAESDPTATTPVSEPLLFSSSPVAESDLTSTIPTSELPITSTTPIAESDLTSTTPISEPFATSTTPIAESDPTSTTSISEPLTTSTSPLAESDLTSTIHISDPLPTSTTPVSESDLTSTTPVSEPPPSPTTPVAESDLTSTEPPVSSTTSIDSDLRSAITVSDPIPSSKKSNNSIGDSDITSTTPVSEPLPLSTTPVAKSDLTPTTSISESLPSLISPIVESDLTSTTSISEPLPSSTIPVTESVTTSTTSVSEPLPSSTTNFAVAESDLTSTTPTSEPLTTLTPIAESDLTSNTSVSEPLPSSTTPFAVAKSDLTSTTPSSELPPISTAPIAESDLTSTTSVSEHLPSSTTPVGESDLTATTPVSEPLPTTTSMEGIERNVSISKVSTSTTNPIIKESTNSSILVPVLPLKISTLFSINGTEEINSATTMKPPSPTIQITPIKKDKIISTEPSRSQKYENEKFVKLFDDSEPDNLIIPFTDGQIHTYNKSLDFEDFLLAEGNTVGCLNEDRQRFQRNILSTAYTMVDGKPTVLFFSKNSSCVGLLSKTGKRSVRSIGSLLPKFPRNLQVEAAGFINNKLYLIDSSRNQNVWTFFFNNQTRSYEEIPHLKFSKDAFLQFCDITEYPKDIQVTAFGQVSRDDPTCLVFDKFSQTPFISENATKEAEALAHAISFLKEKEFITYVDSVFSWLDEAFITSVYIYGSNGELYRIFRDNFKGSLWKKGNYEVLPYAAFPIPGRKIIGGF